MLYWKNEKKFFKDKGFWVGVAVFTSFILSFLLSSLITGSKYGIYDYLPHYYLFENPYDYRDGDIFGTYFFVIGFLIFFFLILSTFAFKEIKKEIKNDPNSIFFIILIPNVWVWFIILMDYIDVSVGYKLNEDSNDFFPVSLAALISIGLIVFAVNKFFKK